MLKKLFAYIKQYKVYAILTPLVMVLEVLFDVFIPFVMARIVDVGIPSSDYGYVFRQGGLMVLLAAGGMVTGALGARLGAVAANGSAMNLRIGLFERIESFSFKNTDKFENASLLTRLTNDVTNLQTAFTMVLRMLARAPMMLIMATVMAFRFSKDLSVIVVCCVPLLAVLVGVIGKFAFPRFETMLKKYDGLNARTQENLIAIRVVKAFVRGDYESEKFNVSATELRDAQRRAERLLVVGSPAVMLIMNGCILLVLWLGGHDVIEGQLLTGQLLGFISYVSQILMSIMMIMMVFVNLVLSSASAKRIVEVLDEAPAISNQNATPGLCAADGSVVFDHVSFSYAEDPNNLTLTDVNLSIASGETVGIIGGSGSAKTTLVQLIPRLYEVLSGSLRVGGHDVREYPIENLRAAVGMVLQKNVLFSGTIAENLRWGNPDATDEELAAACSAAQAHEFILSFPDGYQTELGQGGVNVSGGQKQRLCIARALIKNPKILILDDSTSAVDTATDAAIREAFRKLHSETTVLIIAQRIASVMDADRIVVLNDGQLNDVGTHEELLARNEIYREVYDSQQKGVA